MTERPTTASVGQRVTHRRYVPYSHAVRLHQALEAAHVPNRLVTVKGGGHGDFTRAQERDVHAAIFAFLSEHGLMPAAAAETPPASH